jgi:hypothetical protein
VRAKAGVSELVSASLGNGGWKMRITKAKQGMMDSMVNFEVSEGLESLRGEMEE